MAPNKPAIFRGAASHWPAIDKWTDEYLRYDAQKVDISEEIPLHKLQIFIPTTRSSLSGAEVTVAVTPNGYADALSADKRLFVMPHEETMTMDHFLGMYIR